MPRHTIDNMTTSPMKADETESDISFEVLKKWNLRAGIVHLVQAVLMLLASQLVPRIRDFRLELTTAFQDYDDVQRKLVTNVKDIGSVPIGPLVSVFLFMSAVAHLLVVSPVYFETYCDDIRRGINRARWYEYALSSGLMIVLIAMLFGCRDLASLLLILAVNACMNLFGLLMEVLNQYTTSINWLPFWFGCFAGLWPWIVALMYFLGGGNYDKIPARSRCPAVLRCLHAIDATHVHLTMKWVVSFSISRPFGPSRATTTLRAGLCVWGLRIICFVLQHVPDQYGVAVQEGRTVGRLPVRGAVVRVPVVGVEEPARVGRLRGDAAAELIRRLTIFKFIS